MRLVFMGSPDFAVPALRALARHHEILCVYTQPPRPAGRGKAPRKTPVHLVAEELGLPVRHPVSLKGAEAQAEFAALNADAAVVAAYGLILPQAVLDAPRHGCINIHASLLPRWRGAAPIHRAIMAGDAEAGVTIMQVEMKLDAGPMLLKRALKVGAEETTGELHDRLAELGAEAVVEVLDDLAAHPPVPQTEDGTCYAEKIEKAEARVDWTRPAVEVDRQIRGLSPFPGAWCLAGGERIKLLGSRLAEGQGAPGTVLGGLTIACGAGAVEITSAQREGKRAAGAEAFLRGFQLPDRLD